MEQTQLQHGSQFHLCKHTDTHIRVRYTLCLYSVHYTLCTLHTVTTALTQSALYTVLCALYTAPKQVIAAIDV